MRHFHWMSIDGKSSRDFEVYISGDGTYSSPERAFKEVEVPGRNGTIFLYDGNYKNVDVTYKAWIAKVGDPNEVDLNFRNLRSFLMSREGYFRIEDTYHPDEFRFGAYNSAIDPDVHETLEAVEFEMTFTCKPQRFIKKYYDVPVEIKQSGYEFFNESYFDSKPLVRVYGTGSFAFNDISVTIDSAQEYTDFDCELQEAYKDSLVNNCNGNITLTNARFPYLKSGINTISFEGPSKIELYPREFNL